MPITYDTVANRINVTGYTAIAPCTFTDVYNADKAGTFSLHARVGIAGVDGVPVAVTNALRPTDYVVLGGASGDLYITITNWNLMTNATIQVNGTDRDGAAQTDSIVVVGNGNYNTALWFATVTSMQVTVFNTPGGGSFDYELFQGQWGVVWRMGTIQFYFEAEIMVGLLGAGWFGDTKKMVEFDPGLATMGELCIMSHWAGNITLGTLTDATLKAARDGCFIACLGVIDWFNIATGQRVNLYACAFMGGTKLANLALSNNSRIWCNLLLGQVVPSWCTDSDVANIISCEAEGTRTPVNTTVDRISVFNTTEEAMVAQGVANQIFNNLYARGQWLGGAGSSPIAMLSGGRAVDIINGDLNVWFIEWNSAGPLNRKNQLDLKVVDSVGVGIPNVTAAMVDRFGAAVFNVVTDANGDIATQTILYGYYDQVTGNALQPAPTGYSPHTITISLAGYITRTIVYTMDRQREEIEELLPKGPRKDIEGNLYMDINAVGDLLRIT